MKQRIEIEAATLLERVAMSSFVPTRPSYVFSCVDGDEVHVVPHQAIETFVRNPGVSNFDESRAFAILEAIRTGSSLPPIEVHASEQPVESLTYKLYNGFHRFHLSRSLGFTHVPVIVVPRPF